MQVDNKNKIERKREVSGNNKMAVMSAFASTLPATVILSRLRTLTGASVRALLIPNELTAAPRHKLNFVRLEADDARAWWEKASILSARFPSEVSAHQPA
ncbi:hypothetical protein MRX96_015288 [Rhipicephalus microplus]